MPKVVTVPQFRITHMGGAQRGMVRIITIKIKNATESQTKPRPGNRTGRQVWRRTASVRCRLTTMPEPRGSEQHEDADVFGGNERG